MAHMVLLANALLYVTALVLSLAVLKTLPDDDSRRVRVARWTLVCAGGLAMGVAIALSLMGRWYASGIAGCVAIVIVSGSLWVALTSRFSQQGDDDDDDERGGGGPRKRPDPPAPTEPAGGGPAPDELWSQFDRARAGWDREHVPAA